MLGGRKPWEVHQDMSRILWIYGDMDPWTQAGADKTAMDHVDLSIVDYDLSPPGYTHCGWEDANFGAWYDDLLASFLAA